MVRIATLAFLLALSTLATTFANSLYFSDDESIFRMRTDGSGLEKLVSGLRNPRNLALDIDENHIYWAAGGSIQRSTLDGTNLETLVTREDNEINSQLGFLSRRQQRVRSDRRCRRATIGSLFARTIFQVRCKLRGEKDRCALRMI